MCACSQASSVPVIAALLPLPLCSFLLSYCSSRWPAAGPTAAQMQPALPLHLPTPARLQAQPQVLAAQQPPQQQQQQQQGADALLQQRPACADVDGSSSSSSTGSSQQNGSNVPLAPVQEGSSSSSSQHGSRGGSSAGTEPSRMHTAVAAAVRHPIAELLNQVLLLVGYFCVQAPSNQAMLLFGRSPNILQRLCSMPFQYFSIPELRAVAMPTLLSVCYGADRTCEVVAQHVSLEMLLSFVQQHLAQQLQAQQTQQQQQGEGPEQQQHKQAAGAGLIPPAVQQLLQRLVSPPCGAAGSPSSEGSSSGPFSLARRFPLAALHEAEVYLQKQLEGERAPRGSTAAAAVVLAGTSSGQAAAGAAMSADKAAS
jgi:hypothetical protein